MVKRRVEALLVVPHPLNEEPHAQRIVDLALQHRLPVIFGGRLWAARGALIAYGAQTNDVYRGAAALVAKILKGAKPADLPVEQPTKFQVRAGHQHENGQGARADDSAIRSRARR